MPTFFGGGREGFRRVLAGEVVRQRHGRETGNVILYNSYSHPKDDKKDSRKVLERGWNVPLPALVALFGCFIFLAPLWCIFVVSSDICQSDAERL